MAELDELLARADEHLWAFEDDEELATELAAALRAALAARPQPDDRRPDADVHYDACHSTKCPCFIAGAAAISATPTGDDDG